MAMWINKNSGNCEQSLSFVHVAGCETSCFLLYGTVRDARCIVGIQIQRRKDSGEHKGMKTAPRKLLTWARCDVNSCER